MKLCAISAILIAGAFLLLTTTIDQAAAEPKCKCPDGDVACYQKEADETPDPDRCCCGKKCSIIRVKNVVHSQECVKATEPTRCEQKDDLAGCVCEGNYCNPASSLLPAGILVVMTTAVLCLIVWPTNNIH